MFVADRDRAATVEPSAWRAWCYLVWLSFQRHVRAHLMVWVALALLALTLFFVALQTHAGRWNLARARHRGARYGEHLEHVAKTAALPWQGPAAAGMQMARGAFDTALYHGTGFGLFSNAVVFIIFTAFLLPFWSLSFATEALGREREAGNLLWVLTRPLPRWAIYLAKLAAVLPWCLLLNLGGFALLCLAGGQPGRLALQLYWPAVLCGTFAFAALYHLMGALLRRPATVALLYSFFVETIMLLMPDDLKRFSLSFYVRCLMFDRAAEHGLQPGPAERYQAVGGVTAALALIGAALVLTVVGAWLFNRREYDDTR